MENGKEPAFGYRYANEQSHQEVTGLTKREYFAGLAMQGLLTRVPNRHGGETDLGVIESKRIASESVIMADELLKALEE